MRAPKPHLFCLFLFVLLIGRAGTLGAQTAFGGPADSTSSTTDSTAKKKLMRSHPRYQEFESLRQGTDTFYAMDTSFGFVQRYNLAQSSGLPYADLGVNATPQKSLLLSPLIEPGFQSGFNPFPFQNKNPGEMRFYKAAVPYAKFNYVQGGGVYNIDAFHTQNFGRNWNFVVDFRGAQNTKDIYPDAKQVNLHQGLMLGNNFLTKSGTYQNIIITSWNRSKRLENFGLDPNYTDMFFVPIPPHASETPRYYPNNRTASSFYKTHHHVMLHKLFLGSQHKNYLFHETHWIKDKYRFEETATTPDTELYGNQTPFKTGPFVDSIAWVQWNNEIGFTHSPGVSKNDFMRWKLSYVTQRIVYNSIYKTSKDIYYNQGISARISMPHFLFDGFHVSLDGTAILAGYNEGDYKFNAVGNLAVIPDKLKLQVQLESQAYTAPAYFTKFSSNYHTYINELDKVQVNQASLQLHYKNRWLRSSLALHGGRAGNFIYADKEAIFRQVKSLNYANSVGSINIKIGKFYIDERFTLQYQDQQKLIPTPAFSNLLSLYFEGFIFRKKSMYARFGADIWLQGSYTGYHYQPEMMTFYPGTENTGNHPVADIFFSGRVKAVDLFFKLEHVNARATNYGFNDIYYSALGYPMEPFRARLGISWKFFN